MYFTTVFNGHLKSAQSISINEKFPNFNMNSIDGLSVENGNYLVPKIKLNFDILPITNDIECAFDAVKKFFEDYYYCGSVEINGINGEIIFNNADNSDGVVQVSTGNNVWFDSGSNEITIIDGSNVYLLVHEIIHAIIFNNNSASVDHRSVLSTDYERSVFDCNSCQRLYNIFDEGAPGVYLDIKTRLYMNTMNYSRRFEYGRLTVPALKIYKEDTENACLELSALCQEYNLNLISGKELVGKLEKQREIFLRAKFGDEFDFLNNFMSRVWSYKDKKNAYIDHANKSYEKRSKFLMSQKKTL